MATPTHVTEQRGIDIAGPADAQPIVFVHGAMFTRKMWAPQRDALADEFLVIAPDLPGHGDRSDETFDIEPALELLDDVIESHAGGHAIVVGLSLGGYLSTAYASRHPEKVDGLVVAGCSVNPVRSMNILTRIVGGITRLLTRSGRLEGAVRRLARRSVRNRDISTTAKAEILESGIYPHEFGTPGPDLAGRNFRDALAPYPGPITVVNGGNDRFMRLGEEDHAAAGDEAQLVVLKDVGHVCNLHRPNAFSGLVERFSRRIEREENGRR